MKATRLPEDWNPGRIGTRYALEQGLSDRQIERCIADFRDYWLSAPGQKAMKTDWMRTWQTWVRKAADKHGAKPYTPNLLESPQVVRAEPFYDSSHWDTRLKNLSQDPFWDILEAAGKPKGFARRISPGGDTVYTWDRMPAGLVVRSVEDVR